MHLVCICSSPKEFASHPSAETKFNFSCAHQAASVLFIKGKYEEELLTDRSNLDHSLTDSALGSWFGLFLIAPLHCEPSMCPNVFTTWQWGAGNIYLLVLSSWKINKKRHCHNGVVDTSKTTKSVVYITTDFKETNREKLDILLSSELGDKDSRTLFFHQTCKIQGVWTGNVNSLIVIRKTLPNEGFILANPNVLMPRSLVDWRTKGGLPSLKELCYFSMQTQIL